MIEFAMQHPYLFTIILLAPITFVYDIIITYIEGKQDEKIKETIKKEGEENDRHGDFGTKNSRKI